MKKLLTLGIVIGLAACGGDDDMDDYDTNMELEQPAPAPAPMPADTMTMDSMMHDTMDMGMDTMGTGM